MPETRNAFKFELVGALTAGAGKDRWQAPFAGEVTDVEIIVGTAPTGANLQFDLKKNGTSIYTTATKPFVLAGAVESADATTFKPDSSAVATFAKGDTFTLDIVTVGSTVAGSDADIVVGYVSL